MSKNNGENRIMPDGRPLFAWENEIAMARARMQEAEQLMKEAKQLMQLLGIAEIEKKDDISTDDIVIRFRMIDAVKDLQFEDNLKKHYIREK